jgi:DNA polymerase-4
MERVRTIFHVDMDAFFVSVEELFDPSLRGKAVVVGGSPDQRGVVSAASYEARKFGVHSAMPLRTAGRLCPHAIFIPGQPGRYRDYSKRVHAVLCEFTPQVEMASIDEAYLAMTGTERLHGPPLRAAQKLHDRVIGETGLRCSVGIATSRLLAKVASDAAKPHGMLWVPPGSEEAFLAPLPVRKIPGVGKRTEEELTKLGLRFVGDIAALDSGFLSSRFGKWGLALAGKAKGLDAGGYFDAEVGEDTDPKSISHESTFGTDTADATVLEATLAKLSQMVARRLREHALFARTISIKLRYSDFSTFTRAHTLDVATQIDLDVIEHSRLLFRKTWSGAAVRLLGVQVSGLEASEGQLSLLESERGRKWRNALGAVDHLRDRFGERSVSLASGMQGLYEERVHENPASLPGKESRPAKAKSDELRPTRIDDVEF